MHEEISASHLISIGIDLEESQYVFYSIPEFLLMILDASLSSL